MNVNDMTAQECADWCGEQDGWRPSTPTDTGNWRWEKTLRTGLVDKREDHPHPLTLSGAAAALPEGWTIWDMEQRGKEWVVGAILANHEREIYCTGPDEMTARYRLAVACGMASKEHS